MSQHKSIAGKVVSLEARMKGNYCSELFSKFGLDVVMNMARYFQKKIENAKSTNFSNTEVTKIYPSVDAFYDEVHQEICLSPKKIAELIILEDVGITDLHIEALEEMKFSWSDMMGEKRDKLEEVDKTPVTMPYLFDILAGIDEVHRYGVSFKYDQLSPEMFGLTTIRNNIFSEGYGKFLDVCARDIETDPGKLASIINRQLLTVSLSRRCAKPSEVTAEFLRNAKNMGGFAIVNYRVDTAGDYLGDTQPTVVSGELLNLDWGSLSKVYSSKREIGNSNSSLYRILKHKGK